MSSAPTHRSLPQLSEAPCALKAKDYKSDVQPIWCPGCGDYGALASITRAFETLRLRPEEVALFSGIGCSSRLPAYLKTYGFHGLHGRALPAATGVAVTRPELTVLVVGGDGDGFSIGGNHFVHACRRNANLTYLVMDNRVYGMTKGQASPTSERELSTALTPGGTHVDPFDPVLMALTSGATFLARAFSGDPRGTTDALVQAIEHEGFSFVQLLSPCVTFRPEQREWKREVDKGALAPTDDPQEALARLMSADALATGVLYRGRRPVFPARPDEADARVEDLERPFVV
jgi:2-oxoglutarate ferredoxin oxidoreductase subunit beta